MPTRYRFPAIHLSHGGGPWPLDLRPEMNAAMQPLARYLGSLVANLPQRPRAVLMVSAHWEAPMATLMTIPRQPMPYGHYGFPPSTYQLHWPAPGAVELVPQVRTLLEGAGFAVAEDPRRGFDHGTFVPMMLVPPRPPTCRCCTCRCWTTWTRSGIWTSAPHWHRCANRTSCCWAAATATTTCAASDIRRLWRRAGPSPTGWCRRRAWTPRRGAAGWSTGPPRRARAPAIRARSTCCRCT